MKAKNLSKHFGDFTAVSDISLEIREGECFGLLGPNGAGKSTIISMLYGAMSRSSGELSVLGKDPATHSRSIKKRTGVVTQENALDEGMNVVENMLIFANFFGIKKSLRKDKVDTLLKFMSIQKKAKARIQTLSGGMKRRLVFVRALINNPDFIILDEPTTGLDPAVRKVIWEKIRNLLGQNKTILLTTHYMDEAEILCDRVLIVDEGKVQAQGSPKQLIAEHCPGYVAVLPNTKENIKIIGNYPSLSLNGIEKTEEASGVYLRGPSLTALSQLLEDMGIEPDLIRPSNLEDAFLQITGRGLSADA